MDGEVGAQIYRSSCEPPALSYLPLYLLRTWLHGQHRHAEQLQLALAVSVALPGRLEARLPLLQQLQEATGK